MRIPFGIARLSSSGIQVAGNLQRQKPTKINVNEGETTNKQTTHSGKRKRLFRHNKWKEKRGEEQFVWDCSGVGEWKPHEKPET
jgi:hypothetical protein